MTLHVPPGQAPACHDPAFPTTSVPRLQRATDQAAAALLRLLHVESASGIVLLLAAVVALLWANSPAGDAYFSLWHTPLAVSVGGWRLQQSLHFVVNDIFMTIFFLVVGMEIRREIHHGALAQLRQAALPLVAAMGGVAVPALAYLLLAGGAETRAGWAIPAATDIAFAVGVLALLGRSIPPALRVFLLALAIIDDIAAVLIIAVFYSGGLDPAGLALAAGGVGGVLLLNRMGVASAWVYAVPGALVWAGLLWAGAHPTLAGVLMGLMTPVVLRPAAQHPLLRARQAVQGLLQSVPAMQDAAVQHDLQRLRSAERDLLPPVYRVQASLHPWVAFAIMPIFALANAGVRFDAAAVAHAAATQVTLAVFLALLVGKPVGVLAATWLAVRLRWCVLPAGVNWWGVGLVGMLAGIGFTMSIFIGGLAFADPALLGAAKSGVLLASALAAVLGLSWGVVVRRRLALEGAGS